MKVKNWFKSFFAGAAVGVASSVPGVSGGTIAVILGIFKTIVDSISNILKHFVKSFLTLLPILLGIIIAIIPCIFLFDWAFENFVFGIVSLFAGLIVGSFPGILDEVKSEKPRVKDFIVCACAMLIALALGICSVLFGDKINISSHFANPEWWFYLILIPVGMLAATALVIPGISGSMILLVLGFYAPLLGIATDAMKNIGGEHFWQNILMLAVFAVGVLIGILTIAKLLSYLLKNYHQITFYGIIGFIIGSTVTLYFNKEIYDYYQVWTTQGMPWWVELIIAIFLFGGGVVASYMLVRYKRKHQSQEAENIEQEKSEIE